ncbi:P-loop containing nucleoside triphosphate hydrolase protein [Microdochium bolleyi]|uniref:p-loop containing nucleoside triphosphate hydrolase protein n=1 Tax=Microdochium bolleyi TaxID=196109 RepID=A0A136IZC8_9PEZI|nr:P-loop containing nucleoside triphosphate hydrolase protein [Microdochium bolleyi]
MSKDPSRGVEVILAGLPRTGSVSMAVAVGTLLRGPVMHGGNHLFAKEDDAYGRNFSKAFALRRRGDKAALLKLLRRLFAGYVAVADLPPIAFVEELLELYPEAKVVLVRRDPEKWWMSFNAILQKDTPFQRVMVAPLPGLRWSFTLGRYWEEWWQGILRPGEPVGPVLMERHAEYIRRVVPRERLLEMELSEGWAPLCEFLGKPVPQGSRKEGAAVAMPFPRLNEAKSRDAFFRYVRKKARLVWLGIFTTAGAVGYLGWRAWLGDLWRM